LNANANGAAEYAQIGMVRGKRKPQKEKWQYVG
jgi:hypothetical protein